MCVVAYRVVRERGLTLSHPTPYSPSPLAGAFIALFKYKNPAKPWFMALPQPVQKKLGLVGYSSMTAASVVGAGAGGKSPAVPKAMIKIPSIMRGNNEDSLARAKLLSAASAKGGSGGFAAAGKSSSGYGAV